MRCWQLVAILMSFAFVTSAHAQASEKVTVGVLHSGDDVVGMRLAFALKEALRASQGYQLGTDYARTLVRFNLITLNPVQSRKQTGNWTVASATLTMQNHTRFEPNNPQTWYPIYLTSVLVTCGSAEITECANNLMATLEDVLASYWRDTQLK
jgi:hypothetical protein